ncbi:MAG: ChaN family lipoprotein [Salibacteraceae bacterium]
MAIIDYSKTLWGAFIAIILTSPSMAQKELPSYRIYDSKGKEVHFERWVKSCTESEVVFFGEHHNNPIHHWLQLKLVEEIKERADTLVVGFEMFEWDDQQLLDEYLAGLIRFSDAEGAGNFWNNTKTDYWPIVDFCKTHHVPVVAANVPRRYASLVARAGLHALDSIGGVRWWPSDLSIINPADTNYNAMREMMGGHAGAGTDNLISAQALKDATMAWRIATNLPVSGVFVHINGSFHSERGKGIVPYLKLYLKSCCGRDLKRVMVIAPVETDDPKLDFDKKWSKLGDYIIVTPEDLTKTH